MEKPLHFYVIDERTDNIKYSKSRGLMPYKFKELRCELDDSETKTVIQYTKNGYIYDVLEGDQCYTRGYMTILMRLPKLSYEELLNDALHSKHFDERIGATGIILKDHSKEFENTLKSMNDSAIIDFKNKKNVKRMVVYIHSLIEGTHYITQLENIRDLCKEIELRLSPNKGTFLLY